MQKFDITQRLDPIENNTKQETYILGLLDVIEFLFAELKSSLTEEGRYFGIIKNYVNSITKVYSTLHSNITPSDVEVFGKILYLLKPSLHSEYRRLGKKKLSSADSNICIIRKILGILEEYSEFTYNNEVCTLKKIFDNLYDNIKNKSKKDSMFFFGVHIRTCLQKRLLGKYRLDIFSFSDLDEIKEITLEEEEKITISDNTIFKLNL